MVQIAQQTKEEKIAMYMKCTKKQLAEMLAHRDAFLDNTNEPTATVTTAGDQVIIENFAKKFIESQRDIDPEINAVVQKHFWELL